MFAKADHSEIVLWQKDCVVALGAYTDVLEGSHLKKSRYESKAKTLDQMQIFANVHHSDQVFVRSLRVQRCIHVHKIVKLGHGHKIRHYLGRAKQKCFFEHMRTVKARSVCESIQSDQGPLSREQNHLTLQNISMENKCPDETAHTWDESESVHLTHARRYFLAWRGLFHTLLGRMYLTGKCNRYSKIDLKARLDELLTEEQTDGQPNLYIALGC